MSGNLQNFARGERKKKRWFLDVFEQVVDTTDLIVKQITNHKVRQKPHLFSISFIANLKHNM